MCHDFRAPFAVRRRLLGGLALTPLAALLAACGRSGNWPDGMLDIKWDRDTCVVCNMVISDRRFAGEVRGGSEKKAFKFDDPGCMAIWLKEKVESMPWIMEPATSMWVADFNSKNRDQMVWLDPRRAFFITRTSPMGFNFAAISVPAAGALDFNDMRQHVLARYKK